MKVVLNIVQEIVILAIILAALPFLAVILAAIKIGTCYKCNGSVCVFDVAFTHKFKMCVLCYY